jgi:TolB-like protein/class 3 adenylate cyclase
MAEERAQRRLAAILAADVVGYSRLMQADEAGTLAALKSRRSEILQPLVAKHHGRLIKVMGDGVLVEFASAVEAVICALELQRTMDAASTGLPEDKRIILRIGINLGDVVVEGGDLYGDGVNIAARLEALAEPGGIYVSGKVREEAAGKTACDFVNLGARALKNIIPPVQVYRVAAAAAALSGICLDSSAKPKPSIVSVAVLPFTNMSGDASQEYFADGLTEDLITALAKSRHLSVLSRNATFIYKGQVVNIPDVGRLLGARFVLEGSVRAGGNRVRVSAQLIDAESGTHLWAERFDRELADIFAVQDEIVQAISAQLGFALIEAAATGRRSAPTASLTAYDHLLRGRSAWRRGAVIETRDHYLKAVEADPNYAAALACLAQFYSEDIYMQMSGEPVDDLARLADDFAARALAADDGDSYTHHQVGAAMISLGKLPEARHHLELALSLNPYFVNTTINLGWVIACAGQHREGLAMVERVFGLEPRLGFTMRSVPLWIRCVMGDPDGAIRDLHKIDQPTACYHLILAICLAGAGRAGEAQAPLRAFEACRSPWFDVPGFTHWYCKMLALPADQERILRGVRALGYKV